MFLNLPDTKALAAHAGATLSEAQLQQLLDRVCADTLYALSQCMAAAADHFGRVKATISPNQLLQEAQKIRTHADSIVNEIKKKEAAA